MGCPFLAKRYKVDSAAEGRVCVRCGKRCEADPVESSSGPDRRPPAESPASHGDTRSAVSSELCCTCAQRDRMPSILAYWINEYGFFPKLDDEARAGYETCPACALHMGEACIRRAEAIDAQLRREDGRDADLSALVYHNGDEAPLGPSAGKSGELGPASAQFLLIMDAVNHFARSSLPIPPARARRLSGMLSAVLVHSARYPALYQVCMVAPDKDMYRLKDQLVGPIPLELDEGTGTPTTAAAAGDHCGEGEGAQLPSPVGDDAALSSAENACESDIDPLTWKLNTSDDEAAPSEEEAALAAHARGLLRFEAREEGERLVARAPSARGRVSRVGSLYHAAELFRAAGATQRVDEVRSALKMYVEGWSSDPGLPAWDGDSFGLVPQGAFRGLSDGTERAHRRRVAQARRWRDSLAAQIQRRGGVEAVLGDHGTDESDSAFDEVGTREPSLVRRYARLEPQKAIEWRTKRMKTLLRRSIDSSRSNKPGLRKAHEVMNEVMRGVGPSSSTRGSGGPGADGVDRIGEFMEATADAQASSYSAAMGVVMACTALAIVEWIARSSEASAFAKAFGHDASRRTTGLILAAFVATVVLAIQPLRAWRRVRRARQAVRTYVRGAAAGVGKEKAE